MRLSITKKFLLLLMPLGLVGIAVSWFTLKTLSHSTEDLVAANEVYEAALKSRLYVAEMGSALKGYLIDPSNRSEAERKKAADEENGKLIEHMKSLSQNPELQNLIHELGEIDEKKLNPAEDAVVELIKSGKIEEARLSFTKKYLPLRELYDELSAALSKKAQEISDAEVKAVSAGMVRSAWNIVLVLCTGLVAVGGLILFTVLNLSKALNSIVASLSSEATTLESSASQISQTSTVLAETSTEQASALQETVTAIEEVSAMVAKNAENSKESQSASHSSRNSAENGKNVVNEMIHSISQISESNTDIMGQINANNQKMAEIIQVISEIGSKTKVINDIVFQTKLLSFNASVEAARAGEHGKGFAVVAEEVGNLAQMSGNASKEISQLLESSTQRVQSIAVETKTQVEKSIAVVRQRLESGTQIAQRCGEVLDEIVEKTAGVTGRLEEIATASTEQSQGVQEINKSMTQMDQVMQKNAHVSREASSAAHALNEQAAALRSLVMSLQEAIYGQAKNRPSQASALSSNEPEAKASSMPDPKLRNIA